jgi:hypothetical protein
MKKKILITCIILTLLIISLFSYIRFGGYLILDKQTREKLISEIRNSPRLPERFYEIYGVMYPNSLNPDSWLHFFTHQANSEESVYCVSREATYVAIYPESVSSMEMIPIINFVEDNLNYKECLNFYIKKKAKYIKQNPLLNRDISKMDDSEIIELILQIENMSYYNINRNPDRVQSRIREISNILNNNLN